MAVVIGVDPAYSANNAMGWAILVDGQLAECGLVTADRGLSSPQARVLNAARKLEEALPAYPEVDLLVVEAVKHYPRGRARPNDLIMLSLLAGTVGGMLLKRADRVIYPLPEEWKGGVPKAAHNKRVLKRLQPQELDLLPEDGSLRHNVLDAIGLAQWGHKELK